MIKLFNLDVPLVALALLGLDLLWLEAVDYFRPWLAASLETGAGGAAETVPLRVLFGLALMFVFAVGLYQRRYLKDPALILLRCMVALALACMLCGALGIGIPDLAMPFTDMTAVAIVTMVVLALERIVLLRLAGSLAVMRRVLVIGTGAEARLIEALQQSRGGFVCAGFMSIAGSATVVDKERVLRCLRVEDAYSQSRANEIVVALPTEQRREMASALLETRFSGVRVLSVQSFIERETRRVEPHAIDPVWLAFDGGTRRCLVERALKRAFDVVASTGLLLATVPLQVLAAAAIWLEDGGPIYYRQERVGRNGRRFEMLKFRSMLVDAEKGGVAVWAATNDRRVTRVGATLRKLRIDELPQLLNVIRGEMSFVGPRPERPAIVRKLAEAIPYYDYRHCVAPGITGWAQVNFPYGASIEDAREKLAYDLYYVKNGSLVLDFIIVLQTLRVILWSEGAR